MTLRSDIDYFAVPPTKKQREAADLIRHYEKLKEEMRVVQNEMYTMGLIDDDERKRVEDEFEIGGAL
jgi:uncharacterized protein (DUF169 family)